MVSGDSVHGQRASRQAHHGRRVWWDTAAGVWEAEQSQRGRERSQTET